MCSKITTVANQVEVNGALYLVGCEVRKAFHMIAATPSSQEGLMCLYDETPMQYMYRYKCFADAKNAAVVRMPQM